MAESNQAMLERSMRSVFVGNIPFDLTEEKLKEIFSEVGPVLSFKLVYDRENGKPKGYGFCEYKDVETGNSAMRNLNGYEIGGRILKVDNAANEKTRLEMQNLLQAQEAAQQENAFEHLAPEEAPEAISKAVASLPPEQMFELMKQMKQCVQNNPTEARTMLLQNPQLAYALLQAQVVMRIVDPQVAVNMLHKANVVPEHHPPDSKVLMHPHHQPLPPVVRPEYLPQTQMGLGDSADRPLDPRMGRNPPPMDTDLRFGNQMPPPMPVPVPGPPGPVMPPLTNQHFPTGPGPMPDMLMRDPRQGPPMPVPMPMVPPRDPRGPMVDPRGVGMGGPLMDQRPPAPRQAPPPGPVPAPLAPPARGGVPNLGSAVSDQEKAALIMQVLQLSDEQIAMLPPEQRQSILVLKEQIAKSQR